MCVWPGLKLGVGPAFYAGVGAAACHLAWQISSVQLDSRSDCMAKFVSNQWLGAVVAAGIVADRALGC